MQNYVKRFFSDINKEIKKTLLILILGTAVAFGAGGMMSAGAEVDTGTVKALNPSSSMGWGAEQRYNIDFYQAPLRDVLQFLCHIGDVNVIIPEGLVGTATLSFRDITVRDAITSIVKVNNLEYTVEGGVVRVGPKSAFAETGEDLRTETFRLNYATADDMKAKVEKLLSGRGSVLADERTNSLVVKELPANLENVRRMIEDVDIKDAQVLIEAKILEATRAFSRDLGIQWGVNMSGNRTNVVGLQDVGTADSGNPLNVDLGAGSPTSGLGILIGRLAGKTNIDVQISAAESRGDVYIISDPSIVTSNGKSAHIRSGATLLIQSTGDINIGTPGGTQTTGSAGLREIKTGIELNVTPQISVGGLIKMEIETITSQPDFTRAIAGIPVVVDNEAQTTVLVKDGETTVIGGMNRYNDTLTKRGVPYISRIPLLGNLFKSKLRQRENAELMVFIKPNIVHGSSDWPAQAEVKIKEIEKRRDKMTLEPMLKAEDAKKLKRQRSNNKYTRD